MRRDTDSRAAGLATAGAGGFTLIELVVVMGIITILLSLATLAFRAMNQKYGVESQVKKMQADFDHMRLIAMTTKQKCSIKLTSNSYAFCSYSSEGDPGHTPPGVAATVALQFPLQKFSGGSYSTIGTTEIDLDERGCLSNPAAPLYIAVAPGVTGCTVNAVALQTTKTNVGQIEGGSCALQ